GTQAPRPPAPRVAARRRPAHHAHMTFLNSYGDAARAEAYARLGFTGTYYLAYRDIPRLLQEHVGGRRALDFGCGTGRSTRFLRDLGFRVTGIDISADMVRQAREIDPAGDYRVVQGDDFGGVETGSVDAILAAFTFDNVPPARKPPLLRGLRALLRPHGRLLVLVSSPEIYTHEWASFSTQPFPGNRSARPGDLVYTVITGVGDDRPVEDFFVDDATYRALFREADLEIAAECRPLATGEEPFEWVTETEIAPWVIYVLASSG
ncbi:MAG TPA: class I SAM-dependent methyltransferase, partial [Longimicrobiales bacterium]